MKEDLFQDLKPVGACVWRRGLSRRGTRLASCGLSSTVMLSKLRIRAVVDLIRDGDRRAHASRYDAQLANKLAWVPTAETKVALFDPLRWARTDPGGVRKLTQPLFVGLFAALLRVLPADLAAIAAIGR